MTSDGDWRASGTVQYDFAAATQSGCSGLKHVRRLACKDLNDDSGRRCDGLGC